jgi:hypothetical protein
MDNALPSWFAPDSASVPSTANSVADTAQPTGAPSWFVPDKETNNPIINTNAANNNVSQQEQPINRSSGGKILHAGEVAGAGLGKGAVGMTGLGMALNLPALAEHLGDTAGYYAAKGINSISGKPTPVYDPQNNPVGFTPTTNDIINNVGGKYVPTPDAGNKLEQYIDTASQFVGGAKQLGQSGTQLLLAGGAGLGSEAAGQATKGSPIEPVARLAAGALPYAAAAPFSSSGEPVTVQNPMKPEETISVPEKSAQQAVENIKSQASSPDQLQPTLQQNLGENGGELVQGVQPTLGEVANDQGIAQAQNALKQRYPQPFQAKEAARGLGMAEQLQKGTTVGNPEDIGSFVVSQMNKAEELSSAKEQGMQQSSDQNVAAMQGAATNKIAELGKYGQQPEEGATGDTRLDARAVRKDQASGMYKVLDSVNQEPADHVTLRNAANDVQTESQKAGQRPMGSEVNRITNDILDTSKDRSDNIEELRGYMSQIKELQREQGISPTDKARLGKLLDAANTGLKNTVNGLALQDVSFYNKLLAEKEIALGKTGIGQNTATALQGSESAGGDVFPSSPRAEISQTQRSSGAAGSKSLQENAPTKFGKPELDQYNRANAVYRQNKTLDALEDSNIIKSDGTIDPAKFDRWYNQTKNTKNIAAAGEWGKKLVSAKEAQQSLEQYREQVQKQLDDYRLSRAQANKEFQKTRLSQFIGENTDPVKVVGKIFKDGTKNPAKEMADLVKDLKQDPDAFNGLKAAIAQHINNNVAKANIIESSRSKVGVVGRPNDLQNFFTKNEKALGEVYSPEEIKNIKNVSAEIQRNQQYERMANIKGQSNTAKNLAQNSAPAKQSMYSWVLHGAGKMATGAAILGEHFIGGLHGLAIGYGAAKGAAFLDRLHAAGIENSNALELAMYTNPVFANEMLQRFSGEQPNKILQNRTLQTAAKLVPATSANTQSERNK